LQKFCKKAVHIFVELGPWAANYFILESIEALAAMNDVEAATFHGGGNNKKALLRILKQGTLLKLLNSRSLNGPYLVSGKVKDLMAYLSKQDSAECSGLLFVQQRVTVSVLKTLLSIHPDTKAKFRCATFVGMSNNRYKRYGMAELLDLKAQRETLTEFRAGRKNLIVTTDALEEGIDVKACNLVVCFDPPQNLKSFMQRRGRARQERSNFAIMFPKGEHTSKLDSWRALEDDLIRAYQDELRKVKELAEAEGVGEVVPGGLETKTG
jgi:ERCC4-related helicase